MQLPPYGVVDNSIKPRRNAEPMEHFNGSRADFDKLFNSLLGDISTAIWPVYNIKKACWEGDAANFMLDATRTEIQMMMRSFQANPILNKLPDYVGDIPLHYQKDHMWHFRIEDNLRHRGGTLPVPYTSPDERPSDQDAPWQNAHSLVDEIASHKGLIGMNYLCYDPDSNPLMVSESFFKALASKTRGLYDFKERLQRPRPYQAALIVGEPDFDHEVARYGIHKGAHPSCVSGHCYQGILIACAALEDWIEQGTTTDLRESRLAQFAVDFGDRRVFAGVHYPTDNIASWIVCLGFIPWMFKDPVRIAKFVVDAIRNHSEVYKLATQQFPNDPGLSLSLDLLNSRLDAGA